MKRPKANAFQRGQRRRIGGGVLSPIHRVAVLSFHPRPGERMWLITEFGGALFTRHPIGPRPPDGRVSMRLRRTRVAVRRERRQRGDVPTAKPVRGKGVPQAMRACVPPSATRTDRSRQHPGCRPAHESSSASGWPCRFRCGSCRYGTGRSARTDPPASCRWPVAVHGFGRRRRVGARGAPAHCGDSALIHTHTNSYTHLKETLHETARLCCVVLIGVTGTSSRRASRWGHLRSTSSRSMAARSRFAISLLTVRRSMVPMQGSGRYERFDVERSMR